jgi:MoaA/NifB/PqqE/SkfB family radical SAM enzyme
MLSSDILAGMRTAVNLVFGRPVVVSFEVTLSCIANCRHCDVGGRREGEVRIGPERYKELVEELRPAVVQLSGGEPLLREDICDIARRIKEVKGPPVIILVTNGSLLTPDLYKALKGSGVDRVSISLDFPDKRHDEFRRLPGLYSHLSYVIPRIAKESSGDGIALNSCITKHNMPYIVDLALKAREWGVGISYSAYCILRTMDEDHWISSAEDLLILNDRISRILEMRARGEIPVLNPPPVLRRIYMFFRDGSIPGCRAGTRFLVVRPDGMLNPCSMFREEVYTRRDEMIAGFSRRNRCGRCYVAIRAYSESVIEVGLNALALWFRGRSREGRRKRG